MRAYFLTAVAALALAGCQSAEQKRAAETGEIEVTNGSMEQVTGLIAAARSKTQPQPGMWQTRLEIVTADLSGLPEDKRAAQLAAIKANERNATRCATADDLKPFDFSNLEQVAGKCVFARYTHKDGKIDAEIQCGEGASKTVLAGRGTLGTTGYNIVMDQVTGAKGAANYLGLTLRASGKRVGDCVAKAMG